MKIKIDQAVDAAYIYVVDPIDDGEVVTTIPAESPSGIGYIFLDFDKDGKLLGIEIIGARTILR